MIKLSGLNEIEIKEISIQIADAFYDYPYNGDDKGLIKYMATRENVRTYFEGIVRAAYNSNLLYATSENKEGFLVLTGVGEGSVKFMDGIKMIMAEKKALGGFKKMKDFVSACFCEGGSLETRMKKAKRKFLKVEMLVVRKEFQGQGFMRQMLNYSYQLAEKRGVSVILDTDDKDKSERYQHLGMRLDKVRSKEKGLRIYDLIREIKTA